MTSLELKPVKESLQVQAAALATIPIKVLETNWTRSQNRLSSSTKNLSSNENRINQTTKSTIWLMKPSSNRPQAKTTAMLRGKLIAKRTARGQRRTQQSKSTKMKLQMSNKTKKIRKKIEKK